MAANSVISPVEFLNKQISAAFKASLFKFSNSYNNPTWSLLRSNINPHEPDKITEPVANTNNNIPNINKIKDKITKIVLPHYN